MKKENIKNIVIIILILVILFLLKDCKDIKKVPYWKDPNFKTDTQYVDKPYPIKGDSFPYRVPPLILIKYLKDTSNTNSIKCIDDSLIKVIDSLGGEISSIDKSFLTQFPISPKLIGGKFSLDSIKLDLLEIDGSINSKIYITQYSDYEYQWLENHLRAQEINHRKITDSKKKLTSEFYGNASYELLSKVPYVSMDYNVKYRRLRLSLEPSISIQQNPKLGFQTKLGFKIH